jgi:hypothetical protein
MSILTSLFFALAFTIPNTANAQILTATSTLPDKVSVLSTVFAVDPKTVNAIIKCESGGNPKALNYNKNKTYDHSYWQINDSHRSEALKRGLDIEIPDENLLFGFQLLKEQGLKPWEASKKCWSPTIDG